MFFELQKIDSVNLQNFLCCHHSILQNHFTSQVYSSGKLFLDRTELLAFIEGCWDSLSGVDRSDFLHKKLSGNNTVDNITNPILIFSPITSKF